MMQIVKRKNDLNNINLNNGGLYLCESEVSANNGSMFYVMLNEDRDYHIIYNVSRDAHSRSIVVSGTIHALYRIWSMFTSGELK